MKILLRIPLSPYSGYGNDGIGLTRALNNAGHDVYLQPTHVDAPLPLDIAVLLTKRLEAPFDLGIVHVDPGAMGISDGMRDNCTVTAAWTMWEFSTLDNLKGRSGLRARMKDFDLLLAYDPVTAGAFKTYYKGPIGILQGGYEPSQWKEIERDWGTGPEDRFGFCMVGQLHDRKNPFAAIEAFEQLKIEHPVEFASAELHLKTNVGGLHPGMVCQCKEFGYLDDGGEHRCWIPNLMVHYETWPVEILEQFYASMHCLLAPSRGEGKNMPALEFQSTGGIVIATNWGGHQQWLSSEYAYPLDYELRPISPQTPNCLNADASVEHLKAQMLHVFRNRGEAKRKGHLAAQIIPALCSWDNVAERLFLTIKDTLPDKGAELYNLTRNWREE